MSPTPDYCPFCGGRLRDDESLESHLDSHEECRDRFDGWQQPERTTRPRSPGLSTAAKLLLVGIVAVVMGYSLLVAQQVLLGLLASAIIVVAFVVGGRR